MNENKSTDLMQTNNELPQVKKETLTMQQALIDIVQRPDIDPDRLEKFLDLQIKMEDRQNEKAFNDSMTGFQSECPIIKKTKHVNFGNVDYWYAPLDEMISQIKPLLNKFGLSYTFNMFEMEGSSHAELVTTIYHLQGHKQSYRYHFDPIHDDKKMNTSQRRKSAITFAKREGIQSALGIVVAGQDDDARRAIDEAATPTQLEKIKSLIKSTGTSEENLSNYLKLENLENLNKNDAQIALHALEQRRAAVVNKNKKGL